MTPKNLKHEIIKHEDLLRWNLTPQDLPHEVTTHQGFIWISVWWLHSVNPTFENFDVLEYYCRLTTSLYTLRATFCVRGLQEVLQVRQEAHTRCSKKLRLLWYKMSSHFRKRLRQLRSITHLDAFVTEDVASWRKALQAFEGPVKFRIMAEENGYVGERFSGDWSVWRKIIEARNAIWSFWWKRFGQLGSPMDYGTIIEQIWPCVLLVNDQSNVTWNNHATRYDRELESASVDWSVQYEREHSLITIWLCGLKRFG